MVAGRELAGDRVLEVESLAENQRGHVFQLYLPPSIDLWSRTWEPVIDEGWTPATPDELVNDDYAVTPAACWEEDAICFYHTKGNFSLSTAVSFAPGQTQIAFSVEAQSGKALRAFEPFVWRKDKEWPEWLVLTSDHSPAHEKFSIPSLKAAASKAVEAANAFVEGR